jgi:hypothetical protein
MSNIYTVGEYNKEDIEALDDMSLDDIIEALETIWDGWLPSDYVYSPEYYETFIRKASTTIQDCIKRWEKQLICLER